MSSLSEIGPIVTSQHRVPGRPNSLGVVVVGAGGTGGRLIPPLMQILRRGDAVAIVDGDHVEDRNLARQNFRPRDIGENKAEVMARRYRRDGIEVSAFASMLTKETINPIVASLQASHVIFLGCVDNSAARRVLQTRRNEYPSLWIDGGNEMRGGQVLLSSLGWPFKVSATRTGQAERYEQTNSFTLTGMRAMPQLLKARAEEAQEPSCQDRLDLQTVAVNQLSATCMLNMLSCILYQVPFTTCGAFFSTLNTMSPIKLERVDWSTREIVPELTYASED